MYIAKVDYHNNINKFNFFFVRKVMPFDINLFQINWISLKKKLQLLKVTQDLERHNVTLTVLMDQLYWTMAVIREFFFETKSREQRKID